MKNLRSALTITGIGVSLLTLLIAAPSAAQRREGKAAKSHLEVELATAVRFEKTVVNKNRYRVNITAKGLSLANAKTMVPVATIPVLVKNLPTPVTKSSIAVVTKKGLVEITVKVRDKLYLARGLVVEAEKPKARKFELATRDDVALGQVLPEEKTARELVQNALSRRYLREVKHCGKQAERSRWTTDDRRFWNCVCPITERWRLPKVKGNLRIHQVLVKEHSGFTLTINPGGRVSDCRVWVGAEPPADEQKASDSATPPPSEGEAPQPSPETSE